MIVVIIVALLLFAPVFVEGATELICKSLIFSRFREYASGLAPFFEALIKCGFCTSVWVAILPAFFITVLASPGIFWVLPLFVFLAVVFYRLSNYLHNINDKYFDKYYSTKSKED